MAREEIDSFILKFKSLLLSGRNASLVMKCDAGKAEVCLNVHLGHVPPPPVQVRQQRSCNGPSRQRRRLRRAAARTTSVAEEVTEANEDETEAAEAINAKDNESNIVQPDPETLKDEFCSDDTLENHAPNTSEKESDEALIEKILVTADCQADWKNEYVTKLVDEKLNSIGIKMESIVVNRNVRKCFESCLVMIQPQSRKSIEQETFPIRRWTMECIL